MSTPHFAFVTHAGLPDLDRDDHAAVVALTQRGARVSPVCWDDEDVEWSTFDAVVLRSCWDYHLSPQRFLDWVARLEASARAVWNAPEVLRWNLDKRHLVDLAAQGIDVVPTQVAQPGGDESLTSILAARSWSDAVVKPAISLSAHETWRVRGTPDAEDKARFARLRDSGAVLVQEFMPEIATSGEVSLLYFAGRFSHAARKLPAAGDFRVQLDHGGTRAPVQPGPGALASAEGVLSRIPGPWLYARVDGFERDGRFVLMELEVIDPSLYLDGDPELAGRFADALLAAL